MDVVELLSFEVKVKISVELYFRGVLFVMYVY